MRDTEASIDENLASINLSCSLTPAIADKTHFRVEIPPFPTAMLKADENIIGELTSMSSSSNQRCNVGEGALAVKGRSLRTGKVSFNAKLICPNEFCPRLWLLNFLRYVFDSSATKAVISIGLAYAQSKLKHREYGTGSPLLPCLFCHQRRTLLNTAPDNLQHVDELFKGINSIIYTANERHAKTASKPLPSEYNAKKYLKNSTFHKAPTQYVIALDHTVDRGVATPKGEKSLSLVIYSNHGFS